MNLFKNVQESFGFLRHSNVISALDMAHTFSMASQSINLISLIYLSPHSLLYNELLKSNKNVEQTRTKMPGRLYSRTDERPLYRRQSQW